VTTVKIIYMKLRDISVTSKYFDWSSLLVRTNLIIFDINAICRLILEDHIT